MKLRDLCLTVVMCGGLSAPAMAELRLNHGMGGVPDLGAIQCEYFTELYPNSPTGFRQNILTWAQGYMFALSGKTTDELLAKQKVKWTFNSLTDELVNYCVAHPDVQVPEAVKHLWDQLEAPQKETGS